MGIKLIGVGVLIVYGAMLADVLSHGPAAVGVINGVGNVWSTSIKTVAGQ